MTTEEIRAELAQIVNSVAGTNPDDVQLEKSFTDHLKVDSLEMMDIVYGVEEKYGFEFDDADVKKLKTVGDAVDAIEKALAAKEN